MSRYWRSLAIRVGGSAVMLALLLHFLPFQKLTSAMKSISPVLGLGLLAAYLSLHLLGVTKWRILINLAGARLTFLQAIRCYYLGLFGNIFLPSLVGGDFVRAGLAFRLSRNKPAIVLGSLIDRIQDTIGLLSVAAIGALMLPRSLDGHSRKVFWTVGALLVAGGLGALGALYVTPVRRFPFKVRRIMARVRGGIRSTYVRPSRVFLCFCLGMTIQTCLVGINFTLAEALGLRVAFYVWLFAWPLSKLSGLVPVTQGGIGVREVALVGLMSPFGAPAVLTAAVGLVFEAILISGGLIGGLASLLIGRWASPDRPKTSSETL
ncbi:MAG: flippase-like domain-containing protein [Acidobacteriota bacterium]|nr:flippase-like domain-containing protein [Acidobacteriota bacterium]